MQEELKEAFRMYDREGNGYITTSTLKEILGALDDKLNNADLDGIIAEIDTDGSGTVDFDGKYYLLNRTSYYLVVTKKTKEDFEKSWSIIMGTPFPFFRKTTTNIKIMIIDFWNIFFSEFMEMMVSVVYQHSVSLSGDAIGIINVFVFHFRLVIKVFSQKENNNFIHFI